MEAALRTALPVLLLACAAGCAPSPPPAPPPAPAPAASAPAPAPSRLGTVVAIRPIAGQAPPAAEFVVREDSGATVVVVQPDTAGLAVGERVVLNEEARVRLSRAP